MGHKWDKLGDNEQEQADNRKTTGDDLEATMEDTGGDNWERSGGETVGDKTDCRDKVLTVPGVTRRQTRFKWETRETHRETQWKTQ